MQATIDFVNKRIKELDHLRSSTDLNTSKKSLETHLEIAKELEILEQLKEKIDPSQDFYRGGDVAKPDNMDFLSGCGTQAYSATNIDFSPNGIKSDGGDLEIPTGYIPEYQNKREFKVYGAKKSDDKFDSEPKMTIKPGYPNYQVGDLVFVYGEVCGFGVVTHKSLIANYTYLEIISNGDSYLCPNKIIRYATKEEKQQYKKDNPNVKFNN